MGSRGPLPKPDGAGRRLRDSKVVALTTIQGGLKVSAPPPCPDHYLERTKEAWRAYWASDLLTAVIDPDVEVVGQYFQLLDQWIRVQAIAELTPFTEGSQGQIVAHPAAGQAVTLLKTLTVLGQQLGITPMARQRLGIAVGKHALTAAEVNAMVNRPPKPSRRRGKTIDAQWEGVE